MLLRASLHRPAGHWPGNEAVGALTLNFEERHRRRVLLRTDEGEEVLVNLPKTVAMADADGLQLEDGRWLAIHAAPEPIVEIRHREADQLARLAWHLGNRHLPTEIGDHVLRIRHDHVIENMLRGFGADLMLVQAPFQPEGGAYSGHGERHNAGHEHPRHER